MFNKNKSLSMMLIAALSCGCSVSRTADVETDNKAGISVYEVENVTEGNTESDSLAVQSVDQAENVETITEISTMNEEAEESFAGTLLPKDSMTGEEFHRYLWDLERFESWNSDYEPEGIIFDYLRVANEEQKEKLYDMEKKYGICVEERVRELKTIMGEIAEDAPRLTVDDAMRICSEFEKSADMSGETYMYQLSERFNEIAGAPDEIGGSGLTHIYYYIDDDGTERITIGDTGSVYYWNEQAQEEMVIRDMINGRAPGTIRKVDK